MLFRSPPHFHDGSKQDLREERILAWQNREPLKRPYFYGDPRRIEQTQFPVPELSSLGRKLLGLDDWE